MKGFIKMQFEGKRIKNVKEFIIVSFTLFYWFLETIAEFTKTRKRY
jgi:hypothetical protein